VIAMKKIILKEELQTCREDDVAGYREDDWI
jgi:hypothetical protein